MSLVSAITQSNQDKNDIRAQWKGQGEPFKTFKFATETLEVKHQATVIEQKNIGGSTLIWGNSAFGIWGDFKWGNTASQSFILGLSQLGINALGDRSSTFEIVRVSPPNNLFEEYFLSDYFVNTSETTATLTTGNVNFNLTSEVLISKPVYLDTVNATKARLTVVSTSDISNFTLYMNTQTSESSWESVTNNLDHTFTQAGTQVRYKLGAVQPSKNISKLTLKIN